MIVQLLYVCRSDVARAFSDGGVAHPEGQNEDKNEESLRKNEKLMEIWGKWGGTFGYPGPWGWLRSACVSYISSRHFWIWFTCEEGKGSSKIHFDAIANLKSHKLSPNVLLVHPFFFRWKCAPLSRGRHYPENPSFIGNPVPKTIPTVSCTAYRI